MSKCFEINDLVLTGEQHFIVMHNLGSIESKFKVKINSASNNSSVSYSFNDIFFITVEGKRENVAAAVEFIQYETKEKIAKKIHYPKELEVIFFSTLWKRVIEKNFDVIVSNISSGEGVIIGHVNSVNAAVAFVKELCNSCKLKDHKIEEAYDFAPDASYCQKFRDDIVKISNLPVNTQKLLLSWLNKMPEEKSDDDSVVILDSPKNDTDVPLITISDSDEENIKLNNDHKKKHVNKGKREKKKKNTDILQLYEISSSQCNKKMKTSDSACEVITSNKNDEEDNEEVTGNAEQDSIELEYIPIIDDKCNESQPVINSNRKLRPIVIDGSNVAREHGKSKRVFSCKGIQKSVDFFLKRGHTSVTAFVPLFRRHSKHPEMVDQHILEELAEKQVVAFTPSRKVNGKLIACYDDRFIVDLACRTGGIILSNDNFRDIMQENEDWKKTVEERLLMYCFANDEFMVPEDPLGRNGPRLSEFLSFPESS